MIDRLLERCLMNERLFVRSFGVCSSKVEDLIRIVNDYLEIKGIPRQGRKRRLDARKVTLLFLYFLKNYCSYEKLGLVFGVSTSSAWRYVNRMSEIFEDLVGSGFDIDAQVGFSKVLMVDGSETECERPRASNSFVLFYGRKKMFSIKTQVVIEPLSHKVYSIDCVEGSMHDFELFKWSYDSLGVGPGVCLIADAGYTGIGKIHVNSLCVLKKPARGVLGEADAWHNKIVSKTRVVNEHVIGKLKCFKIFAGKFRHCGCLLSRFERFARIVAWLYNFQLG